MTDINNTVNCTIISAIITTYDNRSFNIADIITRFNLSQSIESVGLRGSLAVIDSVGLLENVPLRGEETLVLHLKASDLGTEKTLYLQIYKIDNMTIKDTNDSVRYILHFISKLAFDASFIRILEPYQGLISDGVKTLFSKYYAPITPVSVQSSYGKVEYFDIKKNAKNKTLRVQQTEGIFQGIIPHYEPSEAMYFLASRSYSSYSVSCSFRFYEDTDNFNFVTDEFLIFDSVLSNKVKSFTYNPVTNKNPEAASEQIFNLEVLEHPDRVDTASDLYSGAYSSNVMEVDFLKKRVTFNNYNYANNFSKYVAMDGSLTKQSPVHSEAFMRDKFVPESAKYFFVFKDYGSKGDIPGQLRSEQYLTEIIANRVAYDHHLNNTVVLAQIKGRLDVKAGDIASLNLPSFTSSNVKTANPQLNGNYLVHSVDHMLEGYVLTTTMKLVKYDWSGNTATPLTAASGGGLTSV